MKIHFIFFIVVFFSISSMLGQEEKNKKTLHIVRTKNPPKIDGILNDDAWKNAEEAKDFTEFRPKMGVKDSTEIKTIVKVTYDDNAIYFGAYLHDEPSKIMQQMTTRDNFGQSDFFGVVLNPNNDAQNDTEFFVFPSGTQADALSTPSNGEDFGWNGVWESATKIVDDGWIVEIKIPYNALRFSNQAIQTWGIQFHRQFRRDRSQYTWNPIDVSKGNIGLYHGELKGIENIEPPTRLSFYPFASGLVNTYDGKTQTDLTFGLDLKYGISENFTLDLTLIPDFSQAGFDKLELNLGPFEQTYSEQRQFFTEGVDLFNKGNLFFSRRVGSAPTGDVELNAHEKITDFPSNVKVLNALKVSGRTKKGLGIGLFNAITEKTYASIRDTITGKTREQLVEPLANYNILVLDQQFNKNSSVSLINTNVTRDGAFRDANVTGLLFDISNKRNTYTILGQTRMSHINLPKDNLTGYSTFFYAGKSHGKFRYSFDHSYADTKYDINDLGFISRNNYNNFGIDLTYRSFEPTKKLNKYFVGTYVN
ncbi:MAG: carbohydrate binding family 9 domain-containing protein, partial [Gelidibacter sp.]|nr:carbohydrate binding family 9 domain-containing protein [Gelidibacter sp.]